jgi:hypothetical protein
MNKERLTMNRFLYIKLIGQELKPHIDRLYHDVDIIWQDDADQKHCSRYALDKINEIFSERIKPEEQASKMADVWSIENVLGYIKEKLEGEEFENMTMLEKTNRDDMEHHHAEYVLKTRGKQRTPIPWSPVESCEVP